MEVDITLTFKKIYEEESDAIFRFCMVRVSSREQALDITQETFLRLWQTLNEDKKVLNNKGFLFTVAHRLIIDWYRKKKTLSLDSILASKKKHGEILDQTTENDMNVGAEGRFLLEQLEKLSPMYRQPLYLRFVEGMLPQEIGKILGISANAASVRVNRGLQELRKHTGYDAHDTEEETT